MRLTISAILFISLFTSCSKNWHIADTAVEYHRFSTNSEEKFTAVDTLIEPFKNQLDAELSETLMTLKYELVKEKPEGTLNNFAVDMVFSEAQHEFEGKVDFAVLNYGGLRINSLAAGPVTKRKFFEIMPFENKMVLIESNGSIVNQLCDRIADYGGWPVSEQLHFFIDNGKANGITVNNVPLDSSSIYRYAIPDYISSGNDQCDFLINTNQIVSQLTIRDAMIRYATRIKDKKQPFEIKKSGRIKILKNE